MEELREEAEWSSYTNSWARRPKGWHWPLSRRATLLLALPLFLILGLSLVGLVAHLLGFD